MQISLDVNGERVDAHVLPRLNLATSCANISN